MKCQRRSDSTNKTGIGPDGERSYKSDIELLPHCIKVGQIKFQVDLRLKYFDFHCGTYDFLLVGTRGICSAKVLNRVCQRVALY